MSGFPKPVRDIINTRANNTCERCGLPALVLQHHHRRPRGAGGSKAADTNVASNALVVHPGCHTAIEENRAAAIDAGWLVRQGQHPADVPVLRCGEWVLLDNYGYTTPTSPQGEE